MTEPRAPLEPPDLDAIRERFDASMALIGPNARPDIDIDALLAHIEAQQRRIAELERENAELADAQLEIAEKALVARLASQDTKIAEQQATIGRLRELLREAQEAPFDQR